MTFQAQPVLRGPVDGTLVLGVSPWLRIFSVVTASGFGLFARFMSGDDALPRLLAWCVCGILALSALSQEKWAFSASGLRRSFGILPLVRSWDLPKERLSSIALRAGKPGEGPGGISDDRDRLEASLHGMGRHAWVALVLVLDDGKSLVLATGKPALHGRLRREGEAIASHLGLAFTDSSGLGPSGSKLPDEGSQGLPPA